MFNPTGKFNIIYIYICVEIFLFDLNRKCKNHSYVEFRYCTRDSYYYKK